MSSANKTGQPAAANAEEALNQLGEDVTLVVDDGPRPAPQEDGSVGDSKPSTILDCTSTPYVVVREGAITVEELREVVPSIVTRSELNARNDEKDKQETSTQEDTEQNLPVRKTLMKHMTSGTQSIPAAAKNRNGQHHQ